MDFQKQLSLPFFKNFSGQSDIPLLFSAQLLVVYLVWVRGMKHILAPFLPFIPGMEILRELPGLYVILDGIYWVSLIAVVFGFRFQQFSLILGILVFLVVFGSKPQFSNSFLFAGCFFLLIGIYRPGLEWIFRVQLSLLYLGAGVNKLLDPDWQSGQYFEYFLSEVYINPISVFIVELIYSEYLFKLLSWITIALELTFGLWALTNRKLYLWFLLVQFFHLSMLVVTVGELSYIFFLLISASGYLILPRPKSLKNQGGLITQVGNADHGFEYLAISKNEQGKRNEKEKSTIGRRNIFNYFQAILYHRVYFGLWVLSVVFICKYKNQLLSLFNI
jgi:hypothetical protein